MADHEQQGRRAVVLVGAAGPAGGRQRGGCARRERKIFRRTFPTGTRQPGEGVGLRPYGNPSKYEKDVVSDALRLAYRHPGIIGKLHASASAGRNHHAPTGSL